MALALKRVKVYLKSAAILAGTVAVLLVVVMNRNHTADFWFFHKYENVGVLWLILATATSSILVWWGAGKVVGVVRDLRELRRTREAERLAVNQSLRDQELTEREKRIDEKIRRSIATDKETVSRSDHQEG